MTKQKIAHIEALRGLAILLVVVGHVIGSAPDGGMKIDFPSPWRYFYIWVDYIQMPLFTAIAGWVYALKPVKKEHISSFISKKFYRLLIPMATIGTIYFLVQYITPGTNNRGNMADIWRIYIFPYTIYWYLPSLFLMFLTTAYIDMRHWADKFEGWKWVLIAAYMGMIAQNTIIPDSIPNLFSFKGALVQFPYFISGMGIQRFSNLLFSSKSQRIYILLATIGILSLQAEWFYPLNKNLIYECLQPAWVICLLALLLHQTKSNRYLMWIGTYAYSIYLFHGFGTAGGRIILTRLGIHAEIPIFLFALIISVFIPIALDKVLNKWKITRFIFFGKK